MAKVRNFFRSPWLMRRETGFLSPLNERNSLMKELYANFQPCFHWVYGDHPTEHLNCSDNGGIRHLDFGDGGEFLLAACERNSVLILDPLSHKLIHTLNHAHDGNINGVKFVASRTFATCGDHAIVLWDARNLKSKVQTFKANSTWVQALDYSSRDRLLITSGYEGSIYTWDINKCYDDESQAKQVFSATGLMRTCLTPDCSKLIMSTRFGYLVIVHDVNYSTLASDLDGFKPDLYHGMQLARSPIPVLTRFNYLFSRHRKANRIELVTDFPREDDAQVISSVQVHPHGFCMVSRNATYDGNSEWTCVHDLRDSDLEVIPDYSPVSNEISLLPHSSQLPVTRNRVISVPSWLEDIPDDPLTPAIQAVQSRNGRRERRLARRRVTFARPSEEDEWIPFSSSVTLEQLRVQLIQPDPHLANQLPHSSAEPTLKLNCFLGDDDDEEDDASWEDWDYYGNLSEGIEAARVQSSISRYAIPFSYDVDEEADESRNGETIHIHPSASHRGTPIIHRPERFSDRLQITSSIRVTTYDDSGNRRPLPRRVEYHSVHTLEESDHDDATGNSTSSNTERTSTDGNSADPYMRIHRNLPRLSHYLRELDVEDSLPKGLGFSPDGRIICSPYGHGVRLLTFNPDCADGFDSKLNLTPVELHQFATLISHENYVLTAKFSPGHCLLVSGCSDGRLVWHQPVM